MVGRRSFKRSIAGLVLPAGFIASVAALTIGTTDVLPAGAQGSHATCSGQSNGMSQDYEITGSGFQTGKAYVVGITPPGATTFYAVATADRSGGWGEYWLPEHTGTYTANVFTYASGTVGRWMTACSFVVS